MKTHHVTWKPSAPYMPEQNSKAERLNLTLINAVRSVLTAIKLPKTLWPEIVQVICNLKNRSSNIDGITPYECLKGTKPNLSHICVLGAHAWVHILKKKKKTWQTLLAEHSCWL